MRQLMRRACGAWIHDTGRDVRFAIRLLSRERAFTAAIVLVLGLGLGIANLQFVLIDAVCIHGLPIPGVDRVLFLGARDAQQRDAALSYRDFDGIRASTHAMSVAAFATAPAVLGDDDRAPDRVLATYVSATMFQVLKEPVLLGRDFTADDDTPGAPAVTILTASVWRSRYSGDPSIIGRAVRVNGTLATVIGVMGGRFRFPAVTDLWLPLAAMPGIAAERRTARALAAVGRLAGGATLAGVRADLAAQSARLALAYPATDTGIALMAMPINERYNGRITDSVWLAFAGVGIVVLLIACANAANLLLIRAGRRGHEIAVRAALGASRLRLVRQMLIEGAVLGALGGAAGAVVSGIALRVINSIVPENTLPYWMRYALDARAFAALAAMALASVFAFGLAPALHVARTDVNAAINTGTRAGAGSVRARRWTAALLTVECGLTMVMLATLVLGVRGVRDAGRRFMLVDPHGVLTSWVTLPAERYRTPDARRDFYRTLVSRVGGLPGAPIVAEATTLPLGGGAPRRLAIDGRPEVSGGTPPTVWTVGISRRYFDALSATLIRGRVFDEDDGRPGHEAVIVNRRFADMFFPQDDALGHGVRLTDPNAPPAATSTLTIVGIAPVIRQRPQVAEPDPVVYLPLDGAPPTSAVLLIRSAGSDPASLAAPLREIVRTLDGELPLYRTMSLEDAIDASRWNGRVSNLLLYVIAAAAIVLATLGLFAVIAHAVEQRTREIGIRVALGAGRSRLLAMVARRTAGHLATGLAAGFACIAVFERITSSGGGEAAAQITRYRITDPLTMTGAVALLTTIAMIAAIVPAWTATRIDPVVALRHE